MTAPDHALPLSDPALGVGAPRLGEPRRGGPTDPSHDERLRRGIIDTEISRGLARALSVTFVAGIFAVPIAQEVMQHVRDEDSVLPELYHRPPSRENLRHFEDDLEQASYAKEWVQPRVQAQLTRFGRVGNKKAVVGRDGWLYYKPGIDFVGGRGFLAVDTLEVRARAAADAGGPAVLPDPRPAILAFARTLAARGIALVVLPMPDKAMLEPRQLHGRAASEGALAIARNPDWERFVAEMTAAGVTLFDPSPPALVAGAPPRYLVQDTHWTPTWMQTVAGALAGVVMRTGRLEPAPPPGWREVERSVTRVGDIVDMLKLPEAQTVFAPQTVTTRAVVDASGGDWEPDEKADVLLLGDSFTNVFSLDSMGWGTAAGLGPHLAFALHRPVDVIAQNDSGAFATRQALARELAGGHDRLSGKKVVVWEFASRELAVGDWKAVTWTPR